MPCSEKPAWASSAEKPAPEIHTGGGTVSPHSEKFPDRKIVTYEDPVEYILGGE